MKVMSVGDFKTHLSDALKSVLAGEEVEITYEKKGDSGTVGPEVDRKEAKQKTGHLRR